MTQGHLLSVWARAALLAGVLAACAGDPAATRGPVTVVHELTVRLAPAEGASPLRGPSKRLEAASRAVTEALGHPLEIELDAALMPTYKDSLDAAMTDDLEGLATLLAEESRRNGRPKAVRAFREQVHKVIVRFDPAAGTAWSPVSVAREGERTWVVRKAAPAHPLVPFGAVFRQVELAAEAVRADVLDGLEPERIARRDEQVGLFDGSTTIPAADEVSRHAVFLKRVELAVRFEAAGSDEPSRRTRAFLLGRALEDLVWRADRAPIAKSDRRVVQAGMALASWLARAWSRLAPEERERALRLFLTRPGIGDVGAVPFDALPYAFEAIDRWRSAGRPLPIRGARLDPAVELALCPQVIDPESGAHVGLRCDGGVAALALRSPSGVPALTAALLARRDEALVSHVVANVLAAARDDGLTRALSLVRGLEGEPTLLRAALQRLAHESAYAREPEPLVVEARRLWTARPAARGALLYLLVHLDPSPAHRPKVDFRDFAPASQADLASYVEAGPHAVALAHVMWPAMGHGFSRAEVLAPAIERALVSREKTGFSFSARTGLVELRHRLCEEAADDDLRRLAAHLKEQAAKRPGEGFSDLAATFDPASCDAPCAERSADGDCRRKMTPTERARLRAGAAAGSERRAPRDVQRDGRPNEDAATRRARPARKDEAGR